MTRRIGKASCTAAACICIAAAMASSGEALAFALSGSRTAQIHRCIDGLARTLPAEATAALGHIEPIERRLLALRSYLRARDSLAARWSWSRQQIASYQRSPEYRTALQELAKVAARFAQLNPGYTLSVNTQVRSLDLQIERWNDNASVGAAALTLAKAVGRRLSRHSCRDATQPDRTLEQFLIGWRPAPAPALAAPGFSRHGRGRAFDFQIKRGNEIVAGTELSQGVAVWDRRGWTGKLQRAVTSATDKLHGPLQIPYEPWHYEYDP